MMFSENGLAVPIPYMAEEEPVSGYSAIVEGRQEEGFRIINKYIGYHRHVLCHGPLE